MSNPDEGDEVEVVDDDLVREPVASRGRRVVNHLRGRADRELTTDEIMSLTRDQGQQDQ